MADITSLDDRRRGVAKIITPGSSGYDTKDLPPITLSRDELVYAELGVLRGQVRQLQSAFEGQRQAVNIHHAALTALEAQTLSGRWRRLGAWARAIARAVRVIVADRIRRLRVWCHGVAIELGLRSPMPPAPHSDRAEALEARGQADTPVEP